MKALLTLLLTLFLVLPALAFDPETDVVEPVEESTDSDVLTFELPSVQESRIAATTAPGAILRGLDKVSGAITNMELLSGESAILGRLEILLGECRYPTGNPSGDAYARLQIRENADETPVFEGWMIASSPALNALDDPRYDVWVLRCITP